MVIKSHFSFLISVNVNIGNNFHLLIQKTAKPKISFHSLHRPFRSQPSNSFIRPSVHGLGQAHLGHIFFLVAFESLFFAILQAIFNEIIT